MEKITVYGAGWCADCRRSRTYLDAHAVRYDYIDIDTTPGAADEVVRINKGLRTIPTIIFADGTILVEPSNKQLADQLAKHSPH